MKWTEILLNLAATKRVVDLVVYDEITRPVREKIAEKLPDGRLQYLVSCPYCVGVWGGFIVMSPWTPKYVRDALAMAGLANAVHWARGIVEAKVD